MRCAICRKLGDEGDTSIVMFTPPINFYGNEVYMWQGSCNTCGCKTAICLTCEEVRERLRVGWYEKKGGVGGNKLLHQEN